MDEDRRGSPRRRVLKGAIVAQYERSTTLPCAVRDLSGTGARIRLEGSAIAPDRFMLVIELDGFEADCEIVHRHARDLGVKFISAPRIVKPRRLQVIKALRAC